MKREKLKFLPISINIFDKKILIVGGGKVGFHKASILSRFTDSARVVSPEFHEGFETLTFELVKKTYQTDDLDGIFMVYICTENAELNATIKADAAARGILASVCDNPELCDFVSPAIFSDSNLSIAVSSDARDVRRSIAVRNRIAELARDGAFSSIPISDKQSLKPENDTP